MGAFTVKPIRPEKLDSQAVAVEITRVLHGEGKLQVRELGKTVKSWTRKVGFAYEVDLSGRDASVLTGPATGNVKIWNYINEGTRTRPIVPKRAKALRFRTGYKAKTRPWHIGSGRSSHTGDWVSTKLVRAHSIQAREWTGTLVSKRKRPFARNINSAIKRGAARMYKKR